MSKYNDYAKRLSTALTTARKEYSDAYDALKQAQAARAAANPHNGMSEVQQARAAAELFAAQEDFKAAESRIWEQFNQTRRDIAAELKEKVKADGLASPDAIDPNGLELLRSGILTPDDFYNLMDKYDDNPTMLRLVGRYAKEAMDDTDDRPDRAALGQIAAACKGGQSGVLRAWDTLSEIADYCSGQKRGRGATPEYVIKMSNAWEKLAGEAVEGF